LTLKVLHLGKFDDVGGIERHVRSLLRGLAATGVVEPVNLVSNDRPRTDSHSTYGYPTVRAACWGSVASLAVSPTLPWLALQLHREHRFDIVHLHFPDPLGQFAASLLPSDVRRVVSWHSDIVRQRLALAVYQPLLSVFLRNASAVVGATPYHFSGSTQVPANLGHAHRAVIPYCLESQHLTESAASRRRADELRAERAAAGGRAIFALGRHVYYKGFDVLIRAMHSIDALLWLGGSGPLTDELKVLVRNEGLQSRVRFVGRVPDEELIAYYEAGDVFVLPSVEKAEAFGLVQLEAMYCQRPVVSCRLGTGVDWVNQDGVTGLIVPPRDAQALAAAVNRLLRDAALRAAMGEAGRNRVEREFSMDTMVRRMLALYREVCGEPMAARAPA
jgi:rhamnosyl/mannosyltransferase